MPTKNCIIYTRVSTDMQAEKEFSSCEAQESKIRSFIESQPDWNVCKVYSDGGYSGATLDRPAIQQFFKDAKNEKIDVVLVYKIDRLTRSPKDFYQLIEFFERSNIDFISITERFDTSTPAGRLLRNIMLTFSQFERELTSERTRDKLLERAKNGLCNGGSTPYGYMRVDKKLVPHPDESKMIKTMFETYLDTQSMAAVYKWLKESGMRNKRGKIFSITKIDKLLRRPVYIGKVYHKGILYDGIHEPLISKEMFELAQKAHKAKTKKFKLSKDFLFGGLVKCQGCGSTMSASFTNKWRNGAMKRYYYYRCTSTTKRDASICSIKQVSADRMERYCVENLERLSIDKTYLENLAFLFNNDGSIPAIRGVEPSDDRSRISAEVLAEILNSFVVTLRKAKGVERNLLAKKSIAKIIYTPDAIKFSFYLKQKQTLCPADLNQAPDRSMEKVTAFSPNENTTPFGSREFDEKTFWSQCNQTTNSRALFFLTRSMAPSNSTSREGRPWAARRGLDRQPFFWEFYSTKQPSSLVERLVEFHSTTKPIQILFTTPFHHSLSH